MVAFAIEGVILNSFSLFAYGSGTGIPPLFFSLEQALNSSTAKNIVMNCLIRFKPRKMRGSNSDAEREGFEPSVQI